MADLESFRLIQIGLTMNSYTHVLPDIERTAVEAAADTIFG